MSAMGHKRTWPLSSTVVSGRLPGNFIDGSIAMRQPYVGPMRALRTPADVYAVPGNHEALFSYRDWMHIAANWACACCPTRMR